MTSATKQPWSLHARLLFVASVALAGFLGVTGVVLDAAFRESAGNALKDRLQGHVYTLLATVEVVDGELAIPNSLPDPRFMRPASGLYAKIRGPGRSWQSLSATGEGLDLPSADLAPGIWRFDEHVRHRDEEMFLLSLGVVFESDGTDQAITITVAEDEQTFAAQVSGFRQSLWTWLGGAALVLLAVQGSVLRWSLTPLRQVADELKAVEAGTRPGLATAYPKELQGLTGNINAFIGSERTHLQRYRNSLSDLAHSLKTPLAVLRAGVEGSGDGRREELMLQVDRMDNIVAHQLQRARASGHLTFAQPLAVLPRAEQVAAALEKVYRHKQVQCDFDLKNNVQFHGDEGDLLEILGNLMDNAFKWCGKRVLLRAYTHSAASRRRPGLTIQVEDDGPGIAPSDAELVLQRGARIDERVQGHGIGLAVVGDIVASYGGQLVIAGSDLGGARVELTFPGRGSAP